MLNFKKVVNENLELVVLFFEGSDTTNNKCNDTGACDVTTNIYCSKK
jgi:hypothetical protein